MKAVILAGGLGTRLSEETQLKPKPMVEIGGRPILWHILKHYAHYGFKEFIIALGYKGEAIKQYFRDYQALNGDMTIRLADGILERSIPQPDDWTLHLTDTGLETQTGGRLGRLRSRLNAEPFMLTYGDGVCNVDLRDLLAFHRRCGRQATVTAVRPPSRFGGLVFDGDLVAEFTEKPQIGEGWINGGYMVLEPAVFRHITADDSSLEIDVLERLARERQLAAYQHEGFWQCMDTLRDKRQLEELWRERQAPWRVWE
ncbi:MAG: glucose-1-phosphate cytidylyltransferase [Acidobacteria bacterium]|nr:glucose-1-phosphate cytidylyltransferase [Acidobacteriota bacterium]